MAETTVERRAPASQKSLRAYEEIKRRIIGLQMAPGTYFTEAGLVEELAIVGKTPIREALVRLRAEGLVEAIPRAGYRVTAVTVRETKDLFSVRILVEAEAARLAAGHLDPGPELRELEELCQAQYDPADPDSVDRFNRANTAFHKGVARLSGNAVLADLLGLVLDRLERVFNVGLRLNWRSEEIVHEHGDLLQALVEGNGDKAAMIAVAQSRTSEQMVLAALVSSGTLQNANVLYSPPAPGYGRRRRKRAAVVVPAGNVPA